MLLVESQTNVKSATQDLELAVEIYHLMFPSS